MMTGDHEAAVEVMLANERALDAIDTRPYDRSVHLSAWANFLHTAGRDDEARGKADASLAIARELQSDWL